MTAQPSHYKVARTWSAMCDAYGVDQKALLERAPLPADFFENEGPGVTTRQFFECWSIFHSFMGDANMALEIGRASVHGPFHSAGYAFSCSETIEAGLERLAVFKPLVGPFDLQLARTEDGLMVRPGSVDDRVDVPPSLVALEVGYFIESFRVCTGHNVVPLRLEIPSETPGLEGLSSFAGVRPILDHPLSILLSAEDAARPLVTQNASFLRAFELEMGRKLRELTEGSGLRAQVRETLMRLLPTGAASADAVARAMGLSKRTLQRRLSESGVQFQTVLGETRRSLALEYLSMDDLRVDEISYLLAYRDSNSFYRAFQGWTGMTPTQAREASREVFEGARPQSRRTSAEV